MTRCTFCGRAYAVQDGICHYCADAACTFCDELIEGERVRHDGDPYHPACLTVAEEQAHDRRCERDGEEAS